MGIVVVIVWLVMLIIAGKILGEALYDWSGGNFSRGVIFVFIMWMLMCLFSGAAVGSLFFG